MGILSSLQRLFKQAPLTDQQLLERCAAASALHGKAEEWLGDENVPPGEYEQWIAGRKAYHFALFRVADPLAEARGTQEGKARLETVLRACPARHGSGGEEVSSFRTDLLWALENYPGSKPGHWQSMIRPSWPGRRP